MRTFWEIDHCSNATQFCFLIYLFSGYSVAELQNLKASFNRFPKVSTDEILYHVYWMTINKGKISEQDAILNLFSHSKNEKKKIQKIYMNKIILNQRMLSEELITALK